MKLDSIEDELRADNVKRRWQRLDLVLAGIGAEIASLFIIALALAILCAPIGFGVGVSWALAAWATRLTGHGVIGWITAIVSFSYFCRYVWGRRLQAASRRAAEALIASKQNL
jgi:hypothetical protein